jgi:hypothetical protein
MKLRVCGKRLIQKNQTEKRLIFGDTQKIGFFKYLKTDINSHMVVHIVTV